MNAAAVKAHGMDKTKALLIGGIGVAGIAIIFALWFAMRGAINNAHEAGRAQCEADATTTYITQVKKSQETRDAIETKTRTLDHHGLDGVLDTHGWMRDIQDR